MIKQALVVGLGQFGMSIARALSQRDVEVIAVDRRKDHVQMASEFAAEAVAFDATDEAALARLAPGRRDLCVCAIGDESRESAILVTALLRQMGAKRLVARGTDDLMERILRLVGAHDVVNPERAFGERLARRLVYEKILEEVPLGEDLVLTQLQPPPAFVGRSLIELALPRRFGVTVVAVRRVVDGHGVVRQPDPREAIRSDDILLVVARRGATEDLLGRL